MMNSIIELIRAVVRPVLALGWAVGTVVMLLLRIPIPEAWWGILSTVITFYFVYRHEEKKVGLP